MENSYCWGTGRRKNALARVRLCPGNGELKINDRTVEDYFPRLVWQAQVMQSLKVANLEGKVDIFGRRPDRPGRSGQDGDCAGPDPYEPGPSSRFEEGGASDP